MKKLFIILFLIFPLGAFGTTETFYVCNGGDGTFPETDNCTSAYDAADFNKASNWDTDDSDDGKIGPNDEVLIMDEGGIIRAQLTIDATSGIPGKPITITNYPGDSPVISAADLIAPGASWTAESTYWYAGSITTDPTVVTFDGAYGYRQTTKGAVNSEYDWWWDDQNDRLYVYAPLDPDTLYTSPGIEYAVRNQALYVDGVSYIDINGLVLTMGVQFGINLDNAQSNNNITNCTMSNNGLNGVVGGGTDVITNILFEDCTTSRNGAYGFSLNDFHTDWTIRRWTSLRDGIISTDYPAAFKQWAEESAVTPQAFNNIIEYSEISYAGYRDDGFSPSASSRTAGIWFDTVYATNPNTGVIARFNYVHDCEGNGIYSEISQYTKFYYNISARNYHNITIQQYGVYPSADNLVYGNTMYGATNHNFFADSTTGNGQLMNRNIVRNNIMDGATNEEVYISDGAANDTTNGTGNLYDSNNFGTEYANFTYWGASGGGNNKSTYDAFIAASSQTDNNVETACMTDPSNGDFTLSAGDPCIDRGTNLGLFYDDALHPSTSFPFSVTTMDQDDHGDDWEIGAYISNGSDQSAINDKTNIGSTGAVQLLQPRNLCVKE